MAIGGSAKSSGSPPQRITCDELNDLMMEFPDELSPPGEFVTFLNSRLFSAHRLLVFIVDLCWKPTKSQSRWEAEGPVAPKVTKTSAKLQLPFIKD